MALREFVQLVDRAGGRERVLLVSEGGPGAEGEPPRWPPTPPALLGTFARELFGEPPPPPPVEEEEQQQEEEEEARAIGARQVRVRIGGLGIGGGVGGGRGGRPPPPPPCALLFVLVRARSLLPPRWGPERRRRLREILRDLRGRLRAGRPAVVGVAVWEAAAAPGTALARDASSEAADAASACPPGCADPEAAARAQLEAQLRRVFRARRRPIPPGLQEETLQAATYRPGGDGGPGAAAADARLAAARALRAALKLRADEAATEKQRLPAFLQCVPWGRPRRTSEGHLDAAAHEFSEDTLQDANEGVALTNMTPNGKCEEAHGRSGSQEADGIPSRAALSG